MICCNCSLVRNESATSTYDKFETLQIENFIKVVKFFIYFNLDEFELKCTCALFETRAILCRHAIFVFRVQCHNTPLLSKYILDHWKKDLSCKYTLIKSSYDNLLDNPNNT